LMRLNLLVLYSENVDRIEMSYYLEILFVRILH